MPRHISQPAQTGKRSASGKAPPSVMLLHDRLDAVAASGLSLVTRAVLARLVRYANAEWLAWPSVQTLASDVGISTRQVQRALRDLEAGCWVARVQSREWGRARVYLVSWKMLAATAAGEPLPAVRPDPNRPELLLPFAGGRGGEAKAVGSAVENVVARAAAGLAKAAKG